MSFSHWTRRLQTALAQFPRRSHRQKTGRPCTLCMERLEDRLVPAIVVTRLSDNATFTSIQAAINDAGTVAGTTLRASAGTDSEQVTINKSHRPARHRDRPGRRRQWRHDAVRYHRQQRDHRRLHHPG
jgi:hypothetical protein